MTEPAIEAVGLSKKFRIRSEVRHTLKERLARGRPPGHRDFWALRDATFSVPKGSSLGIIGHNGSGKSTALKVLTGIYRPTSGNVTVNGRVAALLEVGAGFHPELTGRENIRLNGTILGFTGQEMNRMMDQIIEFADIGEFIDNPIKHYSSGMHVRLGFAVSVMVRPEILIVDEVISVGDEEFQRKCFDHMHGLRRSGTTMVLVSHSLGQVQDLCDETVWLERGEVQQIGPARRVAQAYLERVNQIEAKKAAAGVPAEAKPADESQRRGSGEIRVTAVEFRDSAGQILPRLFSGAAAAARICYSAREPVDRVAFGLQIRNSDDVTVMAVNSGADALVTVPVGDGFVEWVMDPLLLAPGQYNLRTEVSIDRHALDVDAAGQDFVVREGGAHQGGLFVQPGSWQLLPEEGASMGSFDQAASPSSAFLGEQGQAEMLHSTLAVPIPVYVIADRTLFDPRIDAGMPRAAILSLPEAGTYLLAEIVQDLGLINCDIHQAKTHLTDYRQVSESDRLQRPWDFVRDIPLGVAVKFVGPGQFFVGHIQHEPYTVTHLAGIRKLFITREWRTCLLSYFRFERRRVRSTPDQSIREKNSWAFDENAERALFDFLSAKGPDLSALAIEMVAWKEEEGVQLVRFDELIGESGAARQVKVIHEICSSLGLVATDPKATLHRAREKATLTKSGSRTRLEGVWSEEIERFFTGELRGRAINSSFGYSD